MFHMQILLPRGKSAPDVALRLVDIEHLPRFCSKRRINFQKTFGDIFMYRTFAYPELFRRLPYCRVFFDYIIFAL